MLNLIFKNYKKYHENQRKKLRRLIYISSKSNFDAQTLFVRNIFEIVCHFRLKNILGFHETWKQI